MLEIVLYLETVSDPSSSKYVINPQAGAYVGIVSILVVWCTYIQVHISEYPHIYVFKKPSEKYLIYLSI